MLEIWCDSVKKLGNFCLCDSLTIIEFLEKEIKFYGHSFPPFPYSLLLNNDKPCRSCQLTQEGIFIYRCSRNCYNSRSCLLRRQLLLQTHPLTCDFIQVNPIPTFPILHGQLTVTQFRCLFYKIDIGN